MHDNLIKEDSNTREIYFLVIILIVVVFYGLVPMAGAIFKRYKWRQFRNRFNKLRLSSLLDYKQYRQLPDGSSGIVSGIYRFTGGIESITDGNTLWVKGEDLTMPISLNKTKCFLLPVHEGETPEPGAPELIRWNHVSTLTEGAKVFIGGQLMTQDNRLNFCSRKENPLMVIFYNCPDKDFPREIIARARPHGEYWNTITPVSLVAGLLSLVYIAASHLGRPAYHLTVITALIAVFIPILPVIPPGFLLTIFYRRLLLNVRKLKAGFDLAKFDLLEGRKQNKPRYVINAYILEGFACLMLLAGICINVVFLFLLLIQFEVIKL